MPPIKVKTADRYRRGPYDGWIVYGAYSTGDGPDLVHHCGATQHTRKADALKWARYWKQTYGHYWSVMPNYIEDLERMEGKFLGISIIRMRDGWLPHHSDAIWLSLGAGLAFFALLL